MQHWPSWSAPDKHHFSKLLVDGLTYVCGTHVRDNHNETTNNEFAVGGARYKMSVVNEHHSYNGTGRYADLILERFDGTQFRQVFAADVFKDGSDLARWEVLDVTAIELGT